MGMSQSVQESYASSVEMVTSPDEWPIWRTRKPVIIALRHHHGRVEHHRYRYMVVNPGANGEGEGMMDLESVQDDGSASVGVGFGDGSRFFLAFPPLFGSSVQRLWR